MTYRIIVNLPKEQPAKIELDMRTSAFTWLHEIVEELVLKAEAEGVSRLTGIEIRMEK
jgi:hypothetical protein